MNEDGTGPTEGTEESTTSVPEDAFISPDEPIVRRERGVPEEAFISPDEPIVRTDDHSVGTVVGMDGSAIHLKNLAGVHLDADQVAHILEDTAHALREDGIVRGLRVGPDAPHFEAVLKAYLAGYFSTD